jgi:hypothetical protein
VSTFSADIFHARPLGGALKSFQRDRSAIYSDRGWKRVAKPVPQRSLRQRLPRAEWREIDRSIHPAVSPFFGVYESTR